MGAADAQGPDVPQAEQLTGQNGLHGPAHPGPSHNGLHSRGGVRGHSRGGSTGSFDGGLTDRVRAKINGAKLNGALQQFDHDGSVARTDSAMSKGSDSTSERSSDMSIGGRVGDRHHERNGIPAHRPTNEHLASRVKSAAGAAFAGGASRLLSSDSEAALQNGMRQLDDGMPSGDDQFPRASVVTPASGGEPFPQQHGSGVQENGVHANGAVSVGGQQTGSAQPSKSFSALTAAEQAQPQNDVAALDKADAGQTADATKTAGPVAKPADTRKGNRAGFLENT